MQRLNAPSAAIDLGIDAALMHLKGSKDLEADLLAILDIAISMTGADMGMLQRFDEGVDHLRLVAGRGFSNQALSFFGIVRRNTNSSCAAAFSQRMRVFVGDISTNYLFVGTRELEMLRAEGIAAVQSTPLIGSGGRLWGVISTHFRKAQKESAFDHVPLDWLAVRIADSLEDRERLAAKEERKDGGD